MNRIYVLDCTLRDGGYCNEWNFGEKNIQYILAGLEQANADIIECGFLTKKVKHTPAISKFDTFEQLKEVITPIKKYSQYVAMINYGEYPIEEIPENTDGIIDGLRIAFHKKDVDDALEYCRKVQEKGYKVFVQAMVSINYTDAEFLRMIDKVNEFKPFAMYIVDSFGSMEKKQLMRFFYLSDNNLDNDINVGFHSHNNLQFAYSNAQTLIEMNTDRNLILDSSIMGMGRGAGNLNTELIVKYLNEKYGEHYRITPLLNVIDEVLELLYKENYWGYSLPNYLSAKHNCHPNYANFLSKKDTLTVENINKIFESMPMEKRCDFDRAYIEQVYNDFMEQGNSRAAQYEMLKSKFMGKTVLLIASGQSIDSNADKIASAAKDADTISISVNFLYPDIDVDYVFMSNLKRYQEMMNADTGLSNTKVIAVSNIPVDSYSLKVSYNEYKMSIPEISDNSGLMLIKLLIRLGVSKVIIAGMDGYTDDEKKNYTSYQLSFAKKKDEIKQINTCIENTLRDYKKVVDIEFITPTIYNTDK